MMNGTSFYIASCVRVAIEIFFERSRHFGLIIITANHNFLYVMLHRHHRCSLSMQIRLVVLRSGQLTETFDLSSGLPFLIAMFSTLLSLAARKHRGEMKSGRRKAA